MEIQVNKLKIFVVFFIVVVLGITNPAKAAMLNETQTFNEYGFGDRTASSMYGALEYFIPVPGNLVLQEGSALDLVISHSELLRSNRSTMTIFVNDVALFSIFLDESSIDFGKIHIPLPVEAFQDNPDRPAGYTVRIQFFMRITDLICEETTNPALWATVHSESSVTLNAQEREYSADLALLPYPFIISGIHNQNKINFSFMETPSTEDINAAAVVAAYLGDNLYQEPIDFDVRFNEQIDETSPNIAIGFSPEGGVLSGPGTIGLEVAKEQPVLVVGGDSPLLAANALAHPDLFEQLNGSKKIIKKSPDSSLEEISWAWKQDAATFGQLDVSDRTVRGVGEQSVFLYFTRPAGWELTADKIFFDLHLSFSPLLLPEQSGVKVKINGIEIGSISYLEDPGKGDFYRFYLPADTLNVTPEGQYSKDLLVELVFIHHLQESNCEPIFSENAWSTFHSDSYFYFPHTYYDLPDLSLMPYPFLDPVRVDPITIVLPADPTMDEIKAVLMISQFIGQHSYGQIPPLDIVLSKDVEEIPGNVILVGSPTRNPWILEAESDLPPARQGLVQTVVSENAIGNLKLIRSPWATEKWVLIVSSEGTLETVTTALTQPLPSASIIAVRDDGSAEPIFRDVSPPQIPEGSQQTRLPLIPQPETWQIVLGVIVITSLLVLVTILIYRRRSKAS